MRLAGIDVIDSRLVTECIDLAQTHSSPYLFNHVMRSWLLATLVAPQAEVKPDPEVLACAVILHDLGLTKTYEASERFEVDGANAARTEPRRVCRRPVSLSHAAMARVSSSA